MGALTWVMMGLAIWHFTIFLPDRSWGGIVGSFVGAVVGAVVIGVLINGIAIPGESDTDILTAIQGAPGAVIGIAAMYLRGVQRGNEAVEL